MAKIIKTEKSAESQTPPRIFQFRVRDGLQVGIFRPETSRDYVRNFEGALAPFECTEDEWLKHLAPSGLFERL